MAITVGWRLMCHDCGSNCNLHACFVDCDHGEHVCKELQIGRGTFTKILNGKHPRELKQKLFGKTE